MPRDIRPYGAGEGVGFYWIRDYDFPSASLRLVAIDELGNVTFTGVRKKYDKAAPTREQALLEHLSAARNEADASLERRRAAAPEESEEEKPEPVDMATQRFLGDDY